MQTKSPNATVTEHGQPLRAVYLGTHVDLPKHYMEIKLFKKNLRKWVPFDKVSLEGDIPLRYIEKVAELRG